MPDFDTAHVKNVVLLGHSGSGKTTLAESMLLDAGMIHKRGTIEEKNTVADYTDIEKERGNSIFSKLLHTHWKGYKINIIDTPGYDDFSGDVISALRVANTGIMVLNASTGVEVGTDIIWDYTNQFKTPMIFVVNQLDHPQADFTRTVQEAKSHFGTNVVLVQYPVNVGLGFNGIIDVLNMVMYHYSDGVTKPAKMPIPPGERARAESLHKELIESIASNDESLMETYFEKGELTQEEMKEGLHLSMARHDLFPLFCLSAKQQRGVARLMDYIDHVCPPANEAEPQMTKQGKTLPCTSEGPTCAFVFKTVNEPHIGDLSYFKVYSGKVRAGMDLVNATTGANEKISQLFVIEGSKRIPVQQLVAGDIGATLKLRNTHTNNTLHEKGTHLELEPIVFPDPRLTVAIANNKKGEEEKLATVLHQLQEEDPTVHIEVSPELGQTLLHCQGDMHLTVIKWKLQNLYHLDVLYAKPKIAYRETIRRMAEATYRHKKQSGGAGQFGEVTLRIEPWVEDMAEPHNLTVRGKEVYELPWGGKLVYYNCIVGGVIDIRFLPSIYKGIMERMTNGPITGAYVRDIRVAVFDGKMHPVDSNDMAFKSAGMLAFKDAFQKADPQLLEPIYSVEVRCPDDLTGHVMGDLQMRKGMVEGMESEGHFTVIHAKVPHVELYQYASALRGITQGRARFKMRFDHYAPVSADQQRKLAEAHLKDAKELLEV